MVSMRPVHTDMYLKVQTIRDGYRLGFWVLNRYRCLNRYFFFLKHKATIDNIKERLFFIAKAIFFLQIEQYINCLKYILNINTYKTLGFQLQLQTLTSNYEHYINCKQRFIVYLNKYK